MFLINLLYLFLPLYALSGSFVFEEIKSAKKALCYINHTRLNNHQVFTESAFLVPELLSYARNHHLPFVLVIPEYEGLSPLDNKAPWVEGARVALAWSSAFFRFKERGNVDVRVIVYEPDKCPSDLCCKKAIASILQKKFDTPMATPEEAMQQRIVKLKDLNLDDNFDDRFSLQHFEGELPIKDPVYFEVNFSDIGKRMLITGGAGFLGSFIAKECLKRGYQVLVMDNYLCCRADNLKDVEDNPNLQIIKHDVTQPFTISGPIDYVLHLASIPSPEFYYKMPYETLSSGLHGTQNTLELAREKKARYLFSSTSEVYGDPTVSPQPETYEGNVSPIGKRSQYDESKRGAETLIQLYYEQHPMDIRIMRIFNTYGQGMQLNDGRVITNFIERALNHKPFVIYGDGMQTRSFGYVSDTVDGILRILFLEELPLSIEQRVFNVGNPGEFTINELSQKMNKIVEKYLHYENRIEYRRNIDATDPKQRCPDISRIARVAGYQPKVNLEEGLEKTFKWFLRNK